jgi:hypothetical protein
MVPWVDGSVGVPFRRCVRGHTRARGDRAPGGSPVSSEGDAPGYRAQAQTAYTEGDRSLEWG